MVFEGVNIDSSTFGCWQLKTASSYELAIERERWSDTLWIEQDTIFVRCRPWSTSSSRGRTSNGWRDWTSTWLTCRSGWRYRRSICCAVYDGKPMRLDDGNRSWLRWYLQIETKRRILDEFLNEFRLEFSFCWCRYRSISIARPCLSNSLDMPPYY